MIDHQIDRHERVDLFRVAAHPFHGRAQRRQIDHRRYTGEILKQDPGRVEGQIDVADFFGVVGGQFADIVFADDVAVEMAHDAFEQDFDRVGEMFDLASADSGGVGEFIETVDGV